MIENILICGFLATGKDTLLNELIKEPGFTGLVSHTTRTPRPGEVNGKDYYFITPEVFTEVDFIETRTAKNGSYGLSVQEYNSKAGIRKVVILDKQGCEEFIEFAGRENCLVVYLDCNDETIIERASNRGGMTEQQITERLVADSLEFKGIKKLADLTIKTGKNNKVKEQFLEALRSRESKKA